MVSDGRSRKEKKAHQKSSEPFLGTFFSSSQKNIFKGNIIPVSSDDVTLVDAATPYFSDNQERERKCCFFSDSLVELLPSPGGWRDLLQNE